MLCRRLRVLALAVLTAASAAAPSEACCLFGGWGCWRPLSWGSYYRPQMVYSVGYWGGGYWGDYGCSSCGTGCSSCGTGCSSCGLSCNSGACGTGSCGSCSSCSSGCCGTQSYYGPACSSCGDACCGSGWCASGTCGTSNCCTPYNGTTNEPIADPNRSSTPANDSFRSSPSGSGSSIPKTGVPSSIPNTNPGTGEYGSGRNLNDPNSNYLNGTGGDAPNWLQPRPAEPANPGINPDAGNQNMIQIDPLDVDRPVVQAYRPARQRVQVWSQTQVPQVAARALPTTDDLAAPTLPPAVASR